MSEGGMLEWKRQQLMLVKTADYSEIQKPLPKLPNDCEWQQDKDTKEWRVVSIPKSNTTGTVEQDESSLIGQNQTLSTTHKVLPTDTIQGICLKYKISPRELRKANHFTGDNLYLAPETLIIPTKNVTDPSNSGNKDENVGKSVKVSQFLQAVSRSSKKNIGEKEAIAYLDINNWDVDIAVSMAVDDLIYESSMKTS